MGHNFFISHYSGDKVIADLFSNSLRRITLDQISPWFSSDSNEIGGLKPGDLWFNQILSKINQSKAVVALITPNSINRPWIYFETGVGQALDNCEIIPICIGVNRDLHPPLGLYQCYQLNDYRSVVEFFSKLLTLFNIKFDEEMSKIIIEKLVQNISKITFKNELLENAAQKPITDLIENFKIHLDKRFLDLMEKANRTLTFINQPAEIISKVKPNSEIDNGYTVAFDIDFPQLINKNLFIEIRPNDTFQTLTDTLYFMISDFVGPYRYLEEWIIIEQKTNRHVIIREIAEQIPASTIFLPNTKWKIVQLEKPYNPGDSSKRIRKSLGLYIKD